MKKTELRILIVYYGSKSTFIEKDIKILRKYFEVKDVKIKKTKDIFTLVSNILWSDLVYVWFAGKHAGLSVFFSKIFNKKSVVVLGGYDAANIPEIKYGLWAVGKISDRFLAKYALKHADKVVAVDETLIENIIKYVNIKNFEVIPTGYNPEFWKKINEKQNLVLTVGYVDSERRMRVKGIDMFIKVARKIPSTKFLIVGVSESFKVKIKDIAPNNIQILPPMSQSELRKLYSDAKVYCQLSMSEGLPNALCEAMLCECVPVTTDVGGMPKAVGNCGFVIPVGDINSAVNAVKKALKSNSNLGKCARERIEKLFPEEKRERKLLSLIHSLSG